MQDIGVPVFFGKVLVFSRKVPVFFGELILEFTKTDCIVVQDCLTVCDEFKDGAGFLDFFLCFQRLLDEMSVRQSSEMIIGG